ncbi:allantoinase [Bacillus sonorensis L12]|uniref:Allantoinase n=1 Tax=Bacillus sonorensis L12 TaxID=1274524 RepID=M5NYV8_9BACI|nr:allantoinase [Bacillus sonorensis L12]NWN78222.1 amidohydrolase family protein [Bacillus sp. (in: firmicutes)]RHJ08209.1 hypothetical protein DW143_15760 [Bacillus sonorensis]
MFRAWGGISGGQFTLLAMIETALTYKVADWTARTPARRFGLGEKKGRIKVGFDADFAIVNLNDSYTVTKDTMFARHNGFGFRLRRS